MPITTLPTSPAYDNQRLLVQRALLAFNADLSLPITGAGFTGNFIFVQPRGEYWFEVWTRWEEEHLLRSKTTGWAHVFSDLAEFDAMMGSPDPVDTFGYRMVETVGDALIGAFE